jgi:hypothetical protein
MRVWRVADSSDFDTVDLMTAMTTATNQSFTVQYLRIFCALFCSVFAFLFFSVLPLMPALCALIG